MGVGVPATICWFVFCTRAPSNLPIKIQKPREGSSLGILSFSGLHCMEGRLRPAEVGGSCPRPCYTLIG